VSFAFLISIIAVCVLLEGFFSGSEIAVISADRYKLTAAVKNGSKRAVMAMRFVNNPSKFFSTTLLGTNLCVITGSVITTLFIIKHYGGAYAPLALAVWPFILVFGEILPKSVYQHYADSFVVYLAPVLTFFSIIFYPIVWLLSNLTNLILGNDKNKLSDVHSISREDLEVMLEVENSSSSDVMPSERTMISRIFDLADKTVENIMTPLVDVVVSHSSVSLSELKSIFEEYEFSKVPIYEGKVFNIVGVINAMDALFCDGKKDVKDLINPVYYVPEEMPLDELLIAMKRRGENIAVAVDEYGAATGIVTMEDLLEEVVGEIQDEHDDGEVMYRRLGRYKYIVNGRMEIEDMNSRLKLKIPVENYETAAGFVINKFERIPKKGDSFKFGGYTYRVIRTTDKAVLEIEISKG